MRRALRDFLPVLAVAAAFLVAWKLLVVIGGYPAFVLPAPEVVATRLVGAWRDGVMQPHVLTTLSEVLLGFAIAYVAGGMIRLHIVVPFCNWPLLGREISSILCSG